MILTYTNIENALESKDNRESFIYNVRFGDNAHCIFCVLGHQKCITK